MSLQVGPRVLWVLLFLTTAAIPTHAAGFDPTDGLPSIHVTFQPAAVAAAPLVGHINFLSDADAAAASAPSVQAPAVAFDYSDAYHLRAKIHRISSWATIPLFVTEGFLGQSLYNDPTSGKRTAHLVVAGAIGGLFGINTVTGVWNLVEARKDPNGRKLRLAHGLLMLGSDALFLATALAGPGHEGGDDGGGSRSTHRALAFTSISVASTGYLIMLLGNH